MCNLPDLTTEELRNVARLRDIDSYENMSGQQQEYIYSQCCQYPLFQHLFQYLELELDPELHKEIDLNL